MTERNRLNIFFETLARIPLLPLAAVDIKVPRGVRNIRVKNTDTSDNRENIRVNGRVITIPRGGEGVITIGKEIFTVKEYRGREDHNPGALVIMGEENIPPLSEENSEYKSPGGVEIIYRND